MNPWVRSYRSLFEGKWRGVPYSVRGVLEHILHLVQDGQGSVGMPSAKTPKAAFLSLLGVVDAQCRREASDAYQRLTAPVLPDEEPTLTVEQVGPTSWRLHMPAWVAWNAAAQSADADSSTLRARRPGSSADRMRRLRERRALAAPIVTESVTGGTVTSETPVIPVTSDAADGVTVTRHSDASLGDVTVTSRDALLSRALSSEIESETERKAPDSRANERAGHTGAGAESSPVPTRTSDKNGTAPASKRRRSAQSALPGMGGEASDAHGSDAGERHSRPPSGPQQVVIGCFIDEFAKVRPGVKPIINGREAGSAKRLLDAVKGDAELACSIVRDAFNDDWFATNDCSLSSIASNPNKYAGKKKAAPGPRWGTPGRTPTTQPVPEHLRKVVFE